MGALALGVAVGSTMHLRGRKLVVVGKRDDDSDKPPVLVVEDVGS